ncbi:hypothetical protein B0H14DRAFT_3451625 [Mycena olivaceomarginata]|nr:hypothetical protein B0H14DRAFT_3451625 [Mycena olivaceomarginata]
MLKKRGTVTKLSRKRDALTPSITWQRCASLVQLRTLALDATYRYVTDDYNMPEALPPLILAAAPSLRTSAMATTRQSAPPSRSSPLPSFFRLPTVSTILSLHTPACLSRATRRFTRPAKRASSAGHSLTLHLDPRTALDTPSVANGTQSANGDVARQPTTATSTSRSPSYRVPPRDPLAEPIDPNADTFVKVGPNAVEECAARSFTPYAHTHTHARAVQLTPERGRAAAQQAYGVVHTPGRSTSSPEHGVLPTNRAEPEPLPAHAGPADGATGAFGAFQPQPTGAFVQQSQQGTFAQQPQLQLPQQRQQAGAMLSGVGGGGGLQPQATGFNSFQRPVSSFGPLAAQATGMGVSAFGGAGAGAFGPQAMGPQQQQQMGNGGLGVGLPPQMTGGAANPFRASMAMAMSPPVPATGSLSAGPALGGGEAFGRMGMVGMGQP